MIRSPKRLVYLAIGLAIALLITLVHGVGFIPPSPGAAVRAVTSQQEQQGFDLLEAGRAAYQAEQMDGAISTWQSAAEQFEQRGDRLHQALALSYLSLVYQYQGRGQQAADAIAQSLDQLDQWQQAGQDLHEALDPNHPLIVQGQIFNTQGSWQFAQGWLNDALQSWQRAATLYQQADDSQRYTGSLINQARALHALGFFVQARDVLREVQRQLDQENDPGLQVLGLHSLGDTLQAIGDLDGAAQALDDALAIARSQSMRYEQTALLLSLGHLAQVRQQIPEALDAYRQAKLLADDDLQRVQAQVNEFDLLVKTEAGDGAAAVATALLPQFQALPLRRDSLYAQVNFAHRLLQSQQADAASTAAALLAAVVQQAQALGDRHTESYALGYLGHAYEMTQQWAIAKDLTEQALVISQNLDATDITYQWQWQLGRIFKAQDQLDGAMVAYRTALQSLQSLRYDLAAIAPDQQFSFRESVEPVYRDYVDLLLSPVADPSPDRLQQAREVIESLQLAELNNFFRSACLDGQVVTLDEVDQTDAAVIYPIILGDRIEVIVSLPNQPLQHHTAWVSRDQVEATLDDLMQNLMRPLVSPAGKTLGEEVYGWLMRPLAADLRQSGVTTLVFVLDGALRSVPMAALFDGERYLIEDYSIALAPGLQLIAPRPLGEQGIETLAGGLTEARHGFSPLANVSKELNQVESTVPSRILIDQSFTSEALQEQIQALPSPIVHLATHGQFSSRADETFILLWDRPLNVNEISAILQTSDQTRRTPIELLILSACETATGDERAALGLAGIAVQAGARSTIASLWSLDDEAGAVLIGHVYDQLANGGVSKAEALRQAQLMLLNDPDYRRPFLWAPFVLVGNWL